MKVTFKYVGHLFFEIIEFEGRKKAQTSEVEGHHRRHRLLNQLQFKNEDIDSTDAGSVISYLK